jgi:predicted acylesterase/phospholipase RssA
MRKFGLALSGGGFRASLYHLGLLRFLHDAGLLQNVSHITAVSGGSVIAAHLGLNWGRYTGSASDFDAAAGELLDFVRLDVRNRILRRYGLGFLLRGPRRLMGLSNRRFTRTGLLEQIYEKHLYGDTSLFELPEYPSVHLLTTNLSEGRLCSFHREGLMTIRPEAGNSFRIDRISVGLATVSMAVAASSAFPGFFPPLVLTGADVGANRGEFGRLAFTDGGVYDNLGIRMFRFIERSPGGDKLPWDAVLVSDVGRQFEIQMTGARAGGLVRTGMRASEILMNRVWQLENETVQDTTGFVFARVTDNVEAHEDPTAPHVEIQKQLPSVRTDLDCFSSIEISNLIRHGYCVARQACRSMPEVFGSDIPDSPPWDPMADSRRPHVTAAAAGPPEDKRETRHPADITLEARTLYASAGRRIWSTLLDYRDWVSYVYVPLIVPILVLLPYFAFKYHQRSQRTNQIVESLAQGSRDLEQMSRLLEGPVEPWVGVKAEELSPDNRPDLDSFVILQDSRIIDLRKWKSATPDKGDAASMLYGYRRLKVQKKLDNAASNNFRVSILAMSPDTRVRFPAQQLAPTLYSRPLDALDNGGSLLHFEIGADFKKVPSGESVDLVYEHMSPGTFLRSGIDSTTLEFEVEAETIELTRWLLLPRGKEYREFKLIRYTTGKPETPEKVNIVTEYLADDYTILAFKLLSLKAGYTYELTWYYR